MYVYMYKHPAIGLMSRVFTIGQRDRCSIPSWVIPKTQKMILDAVLLNTQHYKVRITGKVEQHLSVVAIEMGAFGLPSTKVANFILLFYVYKQDLALNELLGLICHKTQPN